MQLRDASRAQRPGRYREYTGPTDIDRPTFVHDDPSFDAEVVDHCAFPSLDMHHPGPGPSAVWKTLHTLEVAAAKHPVIVINCDQEESDEEDSVSASENDDQVQNTPLDEDDDDDRCSSVAADVPYRLILTAKDMSKLGQGETDTGPNNCLPRDTSTDKDGDTIMESAVQGSGGNEQRPRRFTVSLVRRPRSPLSLLLEPNPSGRRPKTVSLGLRAPRTAAGYDEPPSPEIVSSPVEGYSWIKDIFQPDADWSRPSYVDDDSADDEIPRVTDVFKTNPNWTDLADGVKYVIIYDMTENGLSFTRACAKLGLGFEDMAEMIELVRVQRRKIYKNNRVIAQQNGHSVQAWLDKDCPMAREEVLVTDFLTEDDIRRGKAFLKFMGLHDVAANMGYYLGSSIGGAAKDYNIPLNSFREDGWQRLIPHFLVGCQEKVEIMWQESERRRKQRPPTMSIAELQVRIDPPPDTVCPKRLKPDAEKARLREAAEVDTREVMPLYLDNFLQPLDDGAIFNWLDGTVITLEERARMLWELEMQAIHRPRLPTIFITPAGGEEINVAQYQMKGQPVAHGARPMDMEAGPFVAQRRPPGGHNGRQITSLPLHHEQRESLPDARLSFSDTSRITSLNREGRQEDVASTAQLESRRRAPSRREDAANVLEPSPGLEHAVARVLNKYQHWLKLPSKSSRSSLSRRSQSLEFSPADEVVQTPNPRQNKKKQVQFEDEDDSDYEEGSHRKRNSPEKKDKRHDGTPRASGRLPQSTGARRPSLDDSPMLARPLLQIRNRHIVVSDDDMDDDDTYGSPSTASPSFTTPRAQPTAAGHGVDTQAVFRPTPRRGDHRAELELLANRIASRSVQELANEYSLRPVNTDSPDITDTAEESPAPPRRRRTQAHGTAVENETTPSTADGAVPSEPRVAGLGQSNKSGTGQAGRSVAATLADAPVLSTTTGSQEPEISPQMTMASPRSNARLLPMDNLTGQDQSFSSARFEAPISSTEPPISVSETLEGGLKTGKGGKADRPVKKRPPRGKKANNAENQDEEKDVPKAKNKRRSGVSVGEAKLDDGSKAAPPKRKSTTPIPLPVLTGIPASGSSSLRHSSHVRKPTSSLRNSSNSASSQADSEGPGQAPSVTAPRLEPKAMLSEEQIRKMGGGRAELEILRNREKAKSAAASSSPHSVNSIPARRSGSLVAESPGSQLTWPTSVPAASQQTVESSPHLSTGSYGALLGQSSPPMPSYHGSPEQSLSQMSPPARRAANINIGAMARKKARGNTADSGQGGTQAQASQMMPAKVPNMPMAQGTRGSNTNASGGSKQTSSRPAVSPLANLPEYFGGERTTSYIQTQDQSINKAFGIAKERTHGVCLPSGGKRPGALVPRPSAISEQYNQLMSGQKIQTGDSSAARSEGYPPGLSGGVQNTLPSQRGTFSAGMSPMAGNDTAHNARLVTGTGPSGFNTGVGAGNPNADGYFGGGSYLSGRPGGLNTFSPTRVPMPMVPSSPEQVQAYLQRQAQLHGYPFSMGQRQGMSIRPPQAPGGPPPRWNMQTVDIGQPFLEGSLNDNLGVGWLNQTQAQNQAQAQQQPDFGFTFGQSGSDSGGFLLQGQGQGQNQNQNHQNNFFQQELDAAASPGQAQGETQSTSTFTDLLGSTGMEFNFDIQVDLGTGANMAGGGGGGLDLDVDMDMGIGAIDPRILGDMGGDDMGDVDMLPDVGDLGGLGDMDMET
ncbi:hypothetical protein QBC37DRAFT_189845 [Rhypophila decipiens]|uniref:Uncharacterized protein n=1 Tax=Rhypophila decipiens TaxID=261697 RepID=A0AAN6YFX1_9PEZI|nr:hypothetical protein QBC37DRAFT_189845 [Rhypophila decipiens]